MNNIHTMMKPLHDSIIGLLRFEAELVIKKYKPSIVAVTGSVGKTSTKDAIFNVLREFYYVRKSEKNFNNDIGIPLTILGVPTGWRNPWKWFKNLLYGLWLIVWPAHYPDWLVVEVGIRKPGDMQKLKRWLSPDIVVVSAFGELPSHVEFFNDKEAVWQEEAAIIDAMKEDGILLLNNDDEKVMRLPEEHKRRCYTFGKTEDATLQASSFDVMYEGDIPIGSHFRLEYDGNSIPFEQYGLVGGGVVATTAAAMLVAYVLGLPMLQAKEGIIKGELPKGRMRLIEGKNSTMLIDDSYNSSPSALSNALESLSAIKAGGRKIAVLGDMLDLGKHTEEAHINKGKDIKESVDLLVTVGPRAKSFITGAKRAGMNEEVMKGVDSLADAEEFLLSIIHPDDLILIKGSQGTRMEKLVASIMVYPEHKEDLLVRQEGQWKHT